MSSASLNAASRSLAGGAATTPPASVPALAGYSPASANTMA